MNNYNAEHIEASLRPEGYVFLIVLNKWEFTKYQKQPK
jgi:hypothetical protein